MGLELIKNPESWKEEWGLNSGHYTVEGLMYRAVEECVSNMEKQKMHPIMVIAEYIVEMKKYYPEEFISDKLLKVAAELLTENYNKVEADEIYYFMLKTEIDHNFGLDTIKNLVKEFSWLSSRFPNVNENSFTLNNYAFPYMNWISIQLYFHAHFIFQTGVLIQTDN